MILQLVAASSPGSDRRDYHHSIESVYDLRSKPLSKARRGARWLCRLECVVIRQATTPVSFLVGRPEPAECHAD